MSSLVASLISSSSGAAPPPQKCSTSPSFQSPQPLSILTNKEISRRSAAVLLTTAIAPLMPFLLQTHLASALSIGISGPKEWLKEQKKKSAKFLLAPIDASRNTLESAYLLLVKTESDFGESDSEEVQLKLVSAARDCVPKDRNSFVEFQANTGVEVCTFRLIVKNASSLLDDKDPVKLEAEAKLSDLIRSFSSLNGLARGSGIQLASTRERVADALKDTIISLVNFEQGIKDCLQV